ncbi:site-2 protease family protein [Salinifilum aidingensis]
MATTSRSDSPGSAGSGGLLLARVAGVPVQLSASWWIGAAVIVLLYAPLVGRILPHAGAWGSALIAAAFTVLLGVSVLLHELGHCLVALRLGLPVRRVRLFLLGGLTEMNRNAPRAGQEAVVAVAGPLVSLALGVVAGAGWFALAPGGAVWLLVAQTCVANLAVGVFNLLPGLPLDGGRLVRAGTWWLTGDRGRGTTAGVIGAGAVAAGLVLWAMEGLVADAQDQWLRLGIAVLMAWFVVAGATSERAAEQERHRAGELPIRQLVRPVLQLPAECPVGDALTAAAGRGVVLVRADGIAVGLLDEKAAEQVAAANPAEPAERAAEPVLPETVLLDADSSEDVLERLRSVEAWQFLVVDAGGRPSGVLRRVDVRSALRGRRPAGL